MSKRATLAATAVIIAVGAAGCGSGSTSSSNGGQPARAADPNAAEVSPAGDIPDNQAYVPYSPRSGDFSVNVPEGWSQTSPGRGVTFTDKLNSVHIETASAPVARTAREARQRDVPRLAASVKGFRRPAVSTVTRKAGTAVRVTYLATAKRDPVTGKTGVDAVERYVFSHKGSNVVLTLSGPQGADNVDPWRTVTDSLTWSR